MTGFQQGLDELVQKGRTQVLRRQIARKFGGETAGQASQVLEGLPGPDGIDRVTDALFECGTGDEFIERVRSLTTGRTDLGREVEAALDEVLAHVRGETSLPCRPVELRGRGRRKRGPRIRG